MDWVFCFFSHIFHFLDKGPHSQSCGFSSSHVWMWELDHKKEAECQKIVTFELWSWRRLLRIPLDSKIKPVNCKGNRPWKGWKDWCWSWSSSTLAIWCKEPTHWKRPCCWERLKAGGEGDDRGWDGWMASPTQRTWVWVHSGSWWWTGRPGVLQSMGSQSQTWLSYWTTTICVKHLTSPVCLMLIRWWINNTYLG